MIASWLVCLVRRRVAGWLIDRVRLPGWLVPHMFGRAIGARRWRRVK